MANFSFEKTKGKKTREREEVRKKNERRRSCRKQEKLCIFSPYIYEYCGPQVSPFSISTVPYKDVNGKYKAAKRYFSFFLSSDDSSIHFSTVVSDRELSNILAQPLCVSLKRQLAVKETDYLCALCESRAHVRIFC